jgi:hypothetical protein
MTGRLLESGMRTSGRETLNSGLLRESRIYCRHCHALHGYDQHAYFNRHGADAGTGLWRPNK